MAFVEHDMAFVEQRYGVCRTMIWRFYQNDIAFVEQYYGVCRTMIWRL